MAIQNRHRDTKEKSVATKKDLEEYNLELEKINTIALDNEEHKELIIRSMKAVVSTCYCCYNPKSLNDSHLSLAKKIVSKLSTSIDDGIKEFCGNANSIFENIDNDDFTKSRELGILESTSNVFSKNIKMANFTPTPLLMIIIALYFLQHLEDCKIKRKCFLWKNTTTFEQD